MMAEAVAPRPGPDDTNLPDQQVKVHRSETKTGAKLFIVD